MIVVVVDRSKMEHFIAMASPITGDSAGQAYYENVSSYMEYHNQFSVIGPLFTSSFWEELLWLQGTESCFSSSYHPQTNKKMEVPNRTLEMYLRRFTGDNLKQWTRWLP